MGADEVRRASTRLANAVRWKKDDEADQARRDLAFARVKRAIRDEFTRDTALRFTPTQRDELLRLLARSGDRP